MRIERGFAIVLALFLMLAVALPAAAQQGRRVEVRGWVVAVDARTMTFLLREDRQRVADFMWIVQISADTRFRVEGRRQGDDDDDNDLGGRNVVNRQQRILEVGHFVEVDGRLIAGNRIQAREINILGHARQPQLPPQVILQPAPVPPQIPGYQFPYNPYPQYPGYPQFPGSQPPFGLYPQQPQILYPQNGAVINTPDFTVIGRTFPYANVHVELSTVFAFFTFGSGSTNVTADGNGFFAATVRPALRLPGASYRITVNAQVSGVQMPPASITVTQQ